MACFQTICWNGARSIQVLLEVQKRIIERGEADSSFHEKKVHVNSFKGKLNANYCLKELFQSQIAFFLKGWQLSATSVLDEAYTIFGTKPLHILRIGTVQPQKKYTFKIFGSNRFLAKPYGGEEQRQTPSGMRVCILRDVNSLFTQSDRETGVSGLQVDYFSEAHSILLSNVFQNSCMRGLLEGKD